MIFALTLIWSAVGFALGYWLGRKRGEQLGRDREWLNSFFRAIENDKKRRGPDGKFIKRHE